MKTISIFIFCCFLLVSCHDNRQSIITFHETINSKTLAKQTVNELVESISYLPLDTCEKGMVSGIDKIRIEGNEIYIGDFHTSKIAVFHKSGKHLYTIDNKGKGPQEYTSIKSFAMDSKYIYIIDNWTAKLIIYNRMDGSFVKQMKMKFIAWDIETLSNGDLIFAFAPISGGKLSKQQPPYRLFVTDTILQVKHTILKYSDKEHDALGQRSYFSRDANNIIFGSYAFDGFSIINPDSLPKLHYVQLKMDNSLTKQSSVHSHEIPEYQYITEVPFKCGKNLYLSLNKNKRIRNGIYNQHTKQLYFNSKTDGNNALIPIVGSENGHLIGYLDDYDNYKKMVNVGFKKGEDKVERTLDKHGFVLVFYKLNPTPCL